MSDPASVRMQDLAVDRLYARLAAECGMTVAELRERVLTVEARGRRHEPAEPSAHQGPFCQGC